MDMQVECTEFQLKSELYKCIMLSCIAGFILGWLLQGPIVKDARKSVVLGEKQKEKENSALFAEHKLRLMHFKLVKWK